MKTLTTQELTTMIDNRDELFLINTLDEQHFNATHIPNSINVPQSRDDFASKVKRISKDTDRKIVVYCASSNCNSSTKAAKRLNEAGFTDVYDYQGGAEAWRSAGQ